VVVINIKIESNNKSVSIMTTNNMKKGV